MAHWRPRHPEATPNRDSWVEDGEYFAIAVDADGRRVDSLTTNNGHLLWSDIVDMSGAKAVVRQLMSERLFYGWGVRTLAAGEGRYNPIGYHVGTIWPFDNSLIAWGRFKEEAKRVAAGILGGRGVLRRSASRSVRRLSAVDDEVPGHYPTACSPQAWSACALPLLLRAMLGVESAGRHLVPELALPSAVGRLDLLDIPGRWGRFDSFARGCVDTSPMDRTR